MAIPAIEALVRAAEQVIVAAPGWGRTLYRDTGARVVPRGEVPDADAGVLFAPSFRAAWEARRLPRRVGLRGDWRGALLTDAIRSPRAHRAEDYAAVSAALGLRPAGRPRFAPRPEERAAADVPEGHIALNPMSPSGAPVMWSGYEDLADRAGAPVVVYAGPGDAPETRHPTRIGQPLGLLAACLERARVMVSNDSGLAHFARAVGTPTVVVFGSTAPSLTGPAGCLPVEGPARACRPCYKKRCRVGGVPCLSEIPVEAVERAIP